MQEGMKVTNPLAILYGWLPTYCWGYTICFREEWSGSKSLGLIAVKSSSIVTLFGGHPYLRPLYHMQSTATLRGISWSLFTMLFLGWVWKHFIYDVDAHNYVNFVMSRSQQFAPKYPFLNKNNPLNLPRIHSIFQSVFSNLHMRKNRISYWK